MVESPSLRSLQITMIDGGQTYASKIPFNVVDVGL